MRSFQGRVKQVRIDENETLMGHVLDLAFPLFRGGKTLSPRQQRTRAHFYQGGQLDGGEPRRRYSGGARGEALPRNRYYTVCPPAPSGGRGTRPKRSADWGLLGRELDAYADWSVSGLVMVFDWGDLDVLPKYLRSIPPPAIPDCLRVLFLRTPGSRSIVDVLYAEQENDPLFTSDNWGGGHLILKVDDTFTLAPGIEYHADLGYCYNIQYRTEELEIPQVADLRYPDTQEAFVRVFCPGLDPRDPASFPSMLPTLVAPSLGGPGATSLIGSYLRTNGARALIYPSARFNTYVQVRDGSPVAYHGWNLVDYRNAPCSHLPAFDAGLFRPDAGSTIVEVPQGNPHYQHGSWKLRRVMENAELRHIAQLKRYLARTALPRVGPQPRAGQPCALGHGGDAIARACSTRSMMSASGMSVWCGPS